MKYYTKAHEWIEVSGETVTMGISNHAAAELGDITFIEIPEEDNSFSQNEVISVIESVKAASDIYCPVDGTVSEVNDSLEDAPEIINEHAEGNGWICKLTVTPPVDLSDFMNEADYKAFLNN